MSDWCDTEAAVHWMDIPPNAESIGAVTRAAPSGNPKPGDHSHSTTSPWYDQPPKTDDIRASISAIERSMYAYLDACFAPRVRRLALYGGTT